MTQKEILDNCKKILYKYAIGETLLEDDEKWIIENRFKYHHEWNEKLDGRVISGIRIYENAYKKRCFMIEFYDGSEVDISYLKGYEKTIESRMASDVLKCIRNADKARVDAARNEFSKSFTGPFEVDHYDSDFIVAASEWINQNGGLKYLYKMVYNNPLEPDINFHFSDEELNKSAAKYLAEHTHLRPLTKEENLKRKKQKNTYIL